MPPQLTRRRVVQSLAGLPLGHAMAADDAAPPTRTLRRVRPGDPDWPSAADWQSLRQQVGDALMPLHSPFDACQRPGGAACDALFGALKNPYALGDDPALTQSLGWVDAWSSAPSAYAVAARSAADVQAAVDFARRHRLRLVVKGGGHGYQGTSCAPDSLLVWTRHMQRIQLHQAFVPQDCDAHPPMRSPTRAVSVEAGAIWAQVYDAVVTRSGAYVQGGGCLTVGVAGLVQSGGFGSFSKGFGLAAGSLLEAEIVTADGALRVVNACREPDLFWALKGGGGGSFGVVTRLTLKLHELPETFGAVNFTVRANGDAGWRRLVARLVDFCAAHLINPHWGEQIRLRPQRVLQVSMVFQGLSRAQAAAVWAPFFDALDAMRSAGEVSLDFAPLRVVSTSARDFFASTFVKRLFGFIGRDGRPGAPASNVFWPGDEAQAGQTLQGYGSAWLPAALLQPARRSDLVDALIAASAHWGVSLHLNKGLAGAPQAAVEAARNSAVHPAMLDAFALAISAAAQHEPAHAGVAGVAGHGPDVAAARQRRSAVAAAMAALQPVAASASYLAESDFFEPDWQQRFWGPHHARLAAVKARVDTDDLFIVHHGIGSQRWSGDGFVRNV